MEASETLTDDQRDALTDELLDYRDLRTDGEYDREEDAAYLADLSDADLLTFWESMLGEVIEEYATTDGTPLNDAWENADVEGVTSPVEWQLEKLLAGEETDYMLPTLANVVSKAVETASAVTFEHGKLDFLLEVLDMTVDDDGYIRDAETGEYKVPYTYQSYSDPQFQPIADAYHDSEDDPLEERLAKTREEMNEPHMHHTDRVHTEEFGGIIHPAFLPGDDPQILVDNTFDMLDLERAGALTTNLKGIDEETAVLTTTGLHAAYQHDAEAMFGAAEDDSDELNID